MKKSDNYDLWWHSFTGRNPETGREKSFFIAFYLCNPDIGGEKPMIGLHPSRLRERLKPSYLMVKAGAWGDDKAQVNKFYGLRRVSIDRDSPFSIKAGECYLGEDATHGSIKVSDEEVRRHPEWICSSGEFGWSLLLDRKSCGVTEYKGEVLWNGRKYNIEPQYSSGFSSHRSGELFSSPLRISSRDGSFVLEKTGDEIICSVRTGKKMIRFNSGDFCTRHYLSVRESRHHFQVNIVFKGIFRRIEAMFRCRKDRTLVLLYESTRGGRAPVRVLSGNGAVGTVNLYCLGRKSESFSQDKMGYEFAKYSVSLRKPKGGTVRRGTRKGAEESPDRKGRSAVESAGGGNLGRSVTENYRR